MELNSMLFPAPKSTYTLKSPIAKDLIYIPRNFPRIYLPNPQSRDLHEEEEKERENLNSHYSKNHLQRYLTKQHKADNPGKQFGLGSLRGKFQTQIENNTRAQSSFDFNEQSDKDDNQRFFSPEQQSKQLNSYKSVQNFNTYSKSSDKSLSNFNQNKVSILEEDAKKQNNFINFSNPSSPLKKNDSLYKEEENNITKVESPKKTQFLGLNTIHEYDEFVKVMPPPISKESDSDEFNDQITSSQEDALSPKAQNLDVIRDQNQSTTDTQKVFQSPIKKSITTLPSLSQTKKNLNLLYSKNQISKEKENQNTNKQHTNQSALSQLGIYLDDDLQTEVDFRPDQMLSQLQKDAQLSRKRSADMEDQLELRTSYIGKNHRKSRAKLHTNMDQHQSNAQSQGHIPCLYIPCDRGSSKLLIYFHANGEDVGIAKEMLDYLQTLLRVHVLAVEYPGYGLYRGNPDANQVMNDAESVYQYFTEYMGLQESQIILFGRSIGSGPVTYIASQYKVCALVLLSPFTSIRDMAKQISGRMLQFLVNDRFRNIDLIQKVKSPTFILHGQKDTLIPLRQSEELHFRCGGPCALVTPKDMDHNNFDYINDLIQPLKQFLSKCNIQVSDYSTNGRLQDGFINGQIQFDESIKIVPEEFMKVKASSGSIWNWVVRKFQRV
eukprot:403334733